MVEIQDAFLYSDAWEERIFERFLRRTYDGNWAKEEYADFYFSEIIYYNISLARVTHVNFLRGVFYEGFQTICVFRRSRVFSCLTFLRRPEWH